MFCQSIWGFMKLLFKMNFITNFFASYITILLFAACSSSNSNQLEHIDLLEIEIIKDESYLKSIDTNKLNQNLKIADLNLLRLENKKLDSISFELIYFQYRDYLNCLYDLKTCLVENKKLDKELKINKNQLSNLKLDYYISKKKATELDKYLAQETDLIRKTSKSIFNHTENYNNQKERFDSLNKSIEDIIDEN